MLEALEPLFAALTTDVTTEPIRQGRADGGETATVAADFPRRRLSSRSACDVDPAFRVPTILGSCPAASASSSSAPRPARRR